MLETFIIALLFFVIIVTNNKENIKKFVIGDDSSIGLLREKDYEFLVLARYGEDVNAGVLFTKRVTNAGYAMLIAFIFYISDLSMINIVKILGITFLIYKLPYFQLKSYYKKYMSKVDQMLPYYLKGLEILCQNYTIPVALSKSIDDAPDIFKPGLREMVAKIDAGDSTVQPYMDFALKYPVKDSMRMMRLLYRLSLGAQENKHEQLILFSKSVSALQNKAREIKYQSRLDWMEKRTMLMLVVTGGGMLAVLMISMFFML